MSTSLRKYGLVCVAATAAGLFLFSQTLTQSLITRDPTPWPGMLASSLVGVYLVALLSPGVFWLSRQLPLERPAWPARVAIHLLASIAFAIVYLALVSVVHAHFHFSPLVPRNFWGAYRLLLIVDFHTGVVFYWLLLAAQHAIRYYLGLRERDNEALRLQLHASELQGQLAVAQLSTLKAQLQPHFLFNTLNAIVALVRNRQPLEAERAIGLLSDLLRCVLEDVDAQEVALSREMDYLERYLAIEQIRFEDKLRVRVIAAAGTQEAAVPHMSLQPIVENAIRHGITRRSAAGTIVIRTRRLGGVLEIEVKDDGPGLQGTCNSGGLGLKNTRARLKRLYGDAARLTVENSIEGGVVAILAIPYHLAQYNSPATGEIV